MIGFAAGRASANHLLFSFSLQLQEKCMCARVMSGCEFVCMCLVCVCVCVRAQCLAVLAGGDTRMSAL